MYLKNPRNPRLLLELKSHFFLFFHLHFLAAADSPGCLSYCFLRLEISLWVSSWAHVFLLFIYEGKILQHDAMSPMVALASWLPSVTSHHMTVFSSELSAQCRQLCFKGIWIFALGRKSLCVVLPHPCYFCSQLNPTLASDVSDFHHPHGHRLETFWLRDSFSVSLCCLWEDPIAIILWCYLLRLVNLSFFLNKIKHKPLNPVFLGEISEKILGL